MTSNPPPSSTDDTPASSQVAVRALELLAARDFVELRKLLAPDVKMDWPYHHSGTPVVIDGADAVIEATRVVDVFQELEIRQIEVNALNNGTTMIEARSKGTYANGRPSYTNHYLFILKVVDGKLTLWREFYNPLEVLKVLSAAKPKKAQAGGT